MKSMRDAAQLLRCGVYGVEQQSRRLIENIVTDCRDHYVKFSEDIEAGSVETYNTTLPTPQECERAEQMRCTSKNGILDIGDWSWSTSKILGKCISSAFHARKWVGRPGARRRLNIC